MQSKGARRLTQLDKENTSLKKLLAEAELEKAMLKILAEGNFGARDAIAGPSRSCRSVTGLLNALSTGWWGSIAAPSAMPAGSSTLRREAKPSPPEDRS